jgi:hypothetical protein
MDERLILSSTQLKNIIDKIDKKYRLEVYRVLKSTYLAPGTTTKDLENITKKIIKLLSQKNLPRSLTSNEIDEILSDLPPLPATMKIISEDNLQQVKYKLKKQLECLKFSITDKTIPELKKRITEQYIKSICPAGESLGINGALAIGQPLTQANLNSRHSSGAKSKGALGLNEIKRLFNVSKDIENLSIVHFKNKNLTQEEIIILGQTLKGINLFSIIRRHETLDTIPDEDKYWYENYLNTMGKRFIFKGSKFLRIYLNINMCYKYNIFAEDVVKAIEKNSRSSEIKNPIKCIAGPSFKGIIDIHVDPEFIRIYIDKMSKDVSKNKIPPTGKIEELTNIFLDFLILEQFKNILVKGIKNIERFMVSEPINMVSIFEESPVINENDLERFSKKPYNLKIDEVSRLWYIKVFKNYILFEGISIEKITGLFECAGIKILENNLEKGEPILTVLLPKKLDIKYYNEETNKVENRYSISENGILYDNKLKKEISSITPKKIIEQKLEFASEYLGLEINKKLLESKNNFQAELPDIPEIYRFGYYYHAQIQGKKIIQELLSNKAIDAKFTYPDNPVSVFEIFGIEAARFYLSGKYIIKDVMLNPAIIELLVDFQVVLGTLSPISFIGVSNVGASVLSSGSFEKPMEVFEKGSAFGVNDKVRGISSCIMSGSRSRNGTGYVELEFDKKYLENPNNKFKLDKNGKLRDVEIDYITGPCSHTVPKDLNMDENVPDLPDSAEFNIAIQGKPSELCLKQEIPNPPRMKAPDFISNLIDEEIIDLEKEYEINKDNWDIDDILDIPDIPDDPGNLSDSDYI